MCVCMIIPPVVQYAGVVTTLEHCIVQRPAFRLHELPCTFFSSCMHSSSCGYVHGLAVGASVNARDYKKRTPLHVAANSGDKEFIALLLDNKADSFITDLDGNTPLDLAAKERYEEAVNFLVTQSYSSKKDDAVKQTIKTALDSERVKDDLVRQKIGEMSPARYDLQ